MTTSLGRESAKIYQFPVRVRAMAGGHREQAKPVADHMSPRAANAAYGDGWYHEAAVQEAERAVKR
jgi:hypothetical protein